MEYKPSMTEKEFLHLTTGDFPVVKPVVKKIARICQECKKPIIRGHKFMTWGEKPDIHYQHRDCKHPDEYPWQVAFRQRY